MSQRSYWVCIDIAKQHLDIHIRPSAKRLQQPNTEQCLAQLVEHLQLVQPELVVLEATGGLEMLCAVGLSSAGIPLAVVNPRQVRDFAKATSRLAKTDRLDAEIIAYFAEAIRPQVRELPDPDAAARHLGELVTRRHQLVEMITAEKNRLGAMKGPN